MHEWIREIEGKLLGNVNYNFMMLVDDGFFLP